MSSAPEVVETPEDFHAGVLAWLVMGGCGLLLLPVVLFILAIPVALVLGIFAAFPPLVPLAVAFAIGTLVIYIRDRRREKKEAERQAERELEP